MEKLVFRDMNTLSKLLNEDDCKKMSEFLEKKFSSFLNQEFFTIQTGFDKNQLQVTLTLRNHDETILYPIEAIYVHDESSDVKLEMSDIATYILDYLVCYFDEFLSQGRNVYLPLDWSVHQFEELKFYLRGFVRNLKFEKIADELLSTHGHGEYHIMPISSEL